VALWHERDISHSSVERIIFPDSCTLLDYMFGLLTRLMDGLNVYPENMKKNLGLSLGMWNSQTVLLALIKKGLTREQAYDLVQRNAMKTWEVKHAGRDDAGHAGGRSSDQPRGRRPREVRRAAHDPLRGTIRPEMDTERTTAFAPIEEAIEDFRQGKFVVVVDAADRENEGDLTIAAQFATPEAINFMATHGRGLICLCLTEERCDELQLRPMTERNETPFGTAFTFPCVTSLLSRVVSSRERGLYMGVQQTFGGAARVIFPVVYGYLFDRVIQLPFLVAAVLVAGTILLGLRMETYAAETA